MPNIIIEIKAPSDITMSYLFCLLFDFRTTVVVGLQSYIQNDGLFFTVN